MVIVMNIDMSVNLHVDFIDMRVDFHVDFLVLNDKSFPTCNSK